TTHGGRGRRPMMLPTRLLSFCLALTLAGALALALTLPAMAQPNPADNDALSLAAAGAAAAPRAIPEPYRFDLAVNQAPAAQVFMQIGAATSYNMLISPDVAGNVTITLKDTTVPEALESMRELFGYDFRITGNRIFVYPNSVQTRLYRINYLPGRRQGASDLRVTSSSITGSGNGSTTGNGTAAPGSGQRPDDSSHVRTTSDADFWAEVRASLQAMVGSEGGRSVVLNPASGVIVVRATSFELRQVDQYLRAIQVSIERQVMIEAKIIEVSLSKEAQTGINWGAFGRILGDKLGVALGVAAPGTVLQTVGALVADGAIVRPAESITTTGQGRGFYGLALQSDNFAALLNFLETQGDVSVLSSPRIATLNNQKAVLKVGTDELYVTGVTTTTTSSGDSSVSSPTLNLEPFFSGIALDVTPQIDEQGNVMLHVHPSISRVTERTKNIDLGDLGRFQLPLATSAISEIDSLVRVRDGEIVAIGGLMKQESRADRSGVQGLQDVPGVGALFRQTSDLSSKRELVILLKPTVIRDDAPWPEAAGIVPVPAGPLPVAPADPTPATTAPR
ncbi:MAG TPA: pilus (MSHA type) biogenesis protein MshL, partial [Rubrivivax sp.]|nr:pilus (MSHA type) biogenesis protein MshL [Rubrivivax sp.]